MELSDENVPSAKVASYTAEPTKTQFSGVETDRMLQVKISEHARTEPAGAIVLDQQKTPSSYLFSIVGWKKWLFAIHNYSLIKFNLLTN